MVAYIYEHLKLPPKSLEDHAYLRTILKLVDARVVIQAAIPANREPGARGLGEEGHSWLCRKPEARLGDTVKSRPFWAVQ